MMEEYGAQGAGMTGRDLKPKLTAVDLWKMWKKRRRNQPKNKDQMPATDIEQQRKSLTTDFSFWKIFPFSKRRREALIQDVCRRLQQASFKQNALKHNSSRLVIEIHPNGRLLWLLTAHTKLCARVGRN